MNKRKQWVRMIASALVVTSLLGFILYKSGISLSQVGEAIVRFGWSGLGIVFAVCLFQTLCMILRVFVLFPPNVQPGFIRVAHAISVGQLVNMFFPARAGDVLKVVLLGGKPKQPTATEAPCHSPSMLTTAGVFLADRIVDLISLLVIIFGTGAYKMPGITLPTFDFPGGTSAIISGVLLVSIFVLGWVFRKRLSQLQHWVRDLKHGLLGALRPKQALAALAFSLGSWACEAAAVLVLANYQGLPITFSQAVFVLCILNIAIAIPVSVANVGPFEASVVFALGTLGATTSQSLAVATVHHGLQLVAIIGWALVTTAVKRWLVIPPVTVPAA